MPISLQKNRRISVIHTGTAVVVIRLFYALMLLITESLYVIFAAYSSM